MVRFSLSQTLSTESLTAIASQTMSQTADEIASEAAPSVAVQPAVVPAAAAPGGEPGAQSETRWPWYAWLALAAIGLLAIYGLFALIAVLRSWLVDLAEARASRMDAALEAKNAPLDSVAEPIQEFPLTAPPKLADQDHAIGESLADEVPDERLVLMHEISELMSRTPDQSLRSKLTLAEAMVESDRLTRARGLLAEVKQLLPKPSQSEQEALARWRKANSA